jgi:hypothetical protein
VNIQTCFWGIESPTDLITLDNESLRLQRLYSSFARGWPGAGLLCLRLIATIATLHYVMIGFVSDPNVLQILVEGVAVAL